MNKENHLIDGDSLAFQAALTGCGQAIDFLTQSNSADIGDLLGCRTDNFDQLDNFVAYTGDIIEKKGRLEHSKILVPRGIAKAIGKVYREISAIDKRVFLESFTDNSFISKLGKLYGGRITSFSIFQSAAWKHSKEFGGFDKVEKLIDARIQEMTEFILGDDNIQMRHSLIDNYIQLKENLSALGSHFGFSQ